jgi:hypothetical protein
LDVDFKVLEIPGKVLGARRSISFSTAVYRGIGLLALYEEISYPSSSCVLPAMPLKLAVHPYKISF